MKTRWSIPLIMTDSINRILIFDISPHKTELLMVSCSTYLAGVMRVIMKNNISRIVSAHT